MSRILLFVYGLAAYGLFLATFLYAIAFTGGFLVPRTVDAGGPQSPLAIAIVVNVLLLGLFAVQHLIMARPAFKAWWTRIIPAAAERSTFVIATCACLGLTFWQWRPIPVEIWRVDHPFAQSLLYGLFALGFLVVLYSSFLIDHFDLFGLRQVVLHARRKEYTHHPFAERSLYRLVQHPLMVGFLIAFWSTPVMTGGHLLFALVTTGYIMVGVRVEERDLAKMLGDDYRSYRARTPRFLPIGRRPALAEAPAGAAA